MDTLDTAANAPRMRRYLGLAGATLLLLFGLVWYLIACHPMLLLDEEYPYWAAKMRMIDQGRLGKLVVLGDSCPMAGVIPARVDAGAVNLGVSGATPLEVYYLVQRIWREPNPPQTVVISLSPSIFNPTKLFWGQSVGFGLLGYRDLDEVRREARRFGDKNLFETPAPGDLDARLKVRLTTLKFPSYYYGNLHGSTPKRAAINRQTYDEAWTSRGHFYPIPAHPPGYPDHDTRLTAFSPSPLLDFYFDRTLAFLAERHVQVYLVTVPHDTASVRLYSPALVEGFDAYMKDYARRYPNFHYLLGLSAWPTENFGDEAHLNEQGARLWSEALRQMLNQAQAPGSPFVPEAVTEQK